LANTECLSIHSRWLWPKPLSSLSERLVPLGASLLWPARVSLKALMAGALLFFTTAPNCAVGEARALQRPLPGGVLEVVARLTLTHGPTADGGVEETGADLLRLPTAPPTRACSSVPYDGPWSRDRAAPVSLSPYFPG
jgi:hypothetical protein